MVFVHVLAGLFAIMMLWRHAPRALLFLAPGAIRVEGDEEAPPRSGAQVAAGERLAALGFRRLGVRREHSPLGGLRMEADAWVHEDGTCADAYPAPGREPVVSFLTTLADGYQLGTSNFRRIPSEGRAGRVGGMAGATLEAALAAHRKGAEALAGSRGAPAAVADLTARVELARRFYAGVGGAELRRPSFMSLVNSAVALVLLASSAKLALRGLGLLG